MWTVNFQMFKLVLEKAAAAAAKSLQSCLTLCDPVDGSPRDSPVPGILQARTLEWVAISFSNACKWKVKVKSFSLVQLLVTPWTAAHQAPPSMGFSRQECWSGVPLSSPRSQRSNCQHLLDHRKSKTVPEKHLFLLYWLCQSLWLCGSQQTVENSSRDGNSRPPALPLEKPVCRSGSKS